MADSDEEDRTEDPTGKRLRESREKGQVPRSKELNTFAMLLAASLALYLYGDAIMKGLGDLMVGELRLNHRDLFNVSAIGEHVIEAFVKMLKMLAPFLIMMVLVAILAPMALGGWNYSGQAFLPNWGKLNPMSGLARMVSMQALSELLKGLAKILLIGGMTAWLFKRYFNEFLNLNQQTMDLALPHSGHLIMVCLLFLCLSLGLIAAFDAPFQLWSHMRQLKMTKQEIKDESRDQDGKPEVKGRIRRMQMEISMRRMMEEVPKADVVLTNPTHYAVALKYDQNSSGAPKVVAKGVDLMAAQIRNLALGAGVPLLASPPLARALYFSTDLEKEIPAGLYLAVAQVLAYVYQLKAAKQHGFEKPKPPTDLKVPEEFLKDRNEI